MAYQIRHTTAFIEVVHNFNNFHQVIEFVNSKNFQTNVRSFSVVSQDMEILDDFIEEFEIYNLKTGWKSEEVAKAFELDLLELYRDFDEFEFRNNWNFEEFEKGSNSEKLLDSIENFYYCLCDEENRKKYESKCEKILNALTFAIDKKILK